MSKNYFNQMQTHGIEQYADWDDALFERLYEDCVQYFSEQVIKSKHSKALIEAYITLLAQGMIEKVILQSSRVEYYQWYKDHLQWNSFLEYLLLYKIPSAIGEVQSKRQMSWMVELWNIGDNLRRQNAWIGLYLNAKTQQFDQSTNVYAQLERILQPLFKTKATSSWKTVEFVEIISTITLSEQFLPGDIHQVAPSVYCVHDRRHKTAFGGIFMQQKQIDLVPSYQCLGYLSDADTTFEYQIHDATLQLPNIEAIELPGLYEPHQHCISSQGCLWLNAIDSQRLWLVKTL